VRIVPTSDLSDGELRALHKMLETSYREEFVEDWEHALGGMHFLIEDERGPVAHASVVERLLEIDGTPLRTGYVEAVATRPDSRRRGFGASIVSAATDHIRDVYELGALGTGEFDFYARFGWERWRGQAFVRAQGGVERTPAEEGYIMILRTPRTQGLDLDAPISCDWRSGDVW